jgi:sn-glycerol 3-phosphate transport system substrate-binding protein
VWEIFGGELAPNTFAALVEEFNARQSTVAVEVERVGGAADLLARLEGTAPSDWPDVVVAQPQAIKRLVDTNRIVPPVECDGGSDVADNLLPVVRATYSMNDVLQAVPYGVSTSVLYFDAAEMRRAGLDPDHPPQTLDQLFESSQQIVDSGASPRGLVTYDWFGTYLINHGAAQRDEYVATPNNGRNGGPVTVDYDTPQNVAAMEWVTHVVDDGGGVWIGGVPSGLEDLRRLVDLTDGGTMTIHTTGSLGDVIAAIDAGSFPGVELGVAPMPGSTPGALLGGNGLWLIDHGDAGRVGAAFEAVRWLSAAPQLARFVAATGYIPPSLDVASEPAVIDAWERHPQLRVGFDQVRGQPGTAAAAGAVFGPSVEIDSLMYVFTKSVVEDHVPPSEALAKLTVDVNALLEEYEKLVPSVAAE